MSAETYNELFSKPYPKNLVLTFDGGIVLTNKDICKESLEITDNLYSNKNVQYGACESKCLKIRVVNNGSFVGKTLTVQLQVKGVTKEKLINEDNDYIVNDDGDYIASYSPNDYVTLSLGTYKVISDKPTNDRVWRDLICYDLMYDLIHSNVADWYKSLTFPMRLVDLRTSLLTYLGIEQVSTTLVNDNFYTPGGFAVSGTLSGKTVMEAICELNGVFGHINKQNKFEYVDITNTDQITYKWYVDGSGSYEDYETDLITGIVAKAEDDDVGSYIGTRVNPYVISGNPLIYGTEGTQALDNALGYLWQLIQNVSYRPFGVKTYGNPMLEVGTRVVIVTRHQTINSFVMTKNLSGIQAMTDKISAIGDKTYPPDTNSVKSEITRLAGITHIMKVEVDELDSEINDASTGIKTQLQQTKNQIVLKVDSNGNIGYTQLSTDPDTNLTSFEIAADTLKFKANKTLDITTANLTLTSTYLDISKFGEITCKSYDGTYKTLVSAGAVDVYYNENGTDYYSGRLRSDHWTTPATGTNLRGCSFDAATGASYLSLGVLNSAGHANAYFMINNGLNPDGLTQRVLVFGDTNLDGNKLYLDNQATEYVWATTYTLNSTSYATVGCYPNLYTPGSAFVNGNLYVEGKVLGDLDFQQASNITNSHCVKWTMANTDWVRMGAYGTSSDDGWFAIDIGDNGNEPIYVRQCTGTTASPTVVRTLTLLDGSGNTSIPGNMTVNGNLISKDNTSNTSGHVMHGRGTGHTYQCNWDSSYLQFYVDTTNVGHVSDRRLKKDIKEVDERLIEAIDSCKIYQFKADNRGGDISFGIIAQDLVDECDKRDIDILDYEILTKTQYDINDEEDYYMIDYGQLAMLEIKALKDEIKYLKNEVSKWKNQ